MPQTIDIHIFNPETDYALAAGNNAYNPPARIIRLRQELAFLPSAYAADNDWIMTFDSVPPTSEEGTRYRDTALKRGIMTVNIGSLKEEMDRRPSSSFRITPWGWNNSLRIALEKAGIDEKYLKSQEEITTLRFLSHRRTCIDFQKRFRTLFPNLDIHVAQEIFTPEEAIEFLSSNGKAYFKLPWSSSGRGILYVEGEADGKTLEWIAGGIRRQGSVMAEHAFHRRLDFATEWVCTDGEAFFSGLSVFHTSPDGRYAGNVTAPQNELNEMVSEASGEWSGRIIDAQKTILQSIIAPRYSGPVGIDMLATADGHINPCVEINLRMTMGMVALARQKRNL